jgi:hypothetical protein
MLLFIEGKERKKKTRNGKKNEVVALYVGIE